MPLFIFIINLRHLPSILLFKILVQRPCFHTVSNACLKSMKTQKNFFFLFNANLLRNSMPNILSVVQQAFLNPDCTSLINLINSYSSAKVFRKSRLKLYTTTESVMRLVTTLLNQIVLQLRYATKILIGAFLKNRPFLKRTVDNMAPETWK